MIKNLRVWFYGRDNKALDGSNGYPFMYYYGLLAQLENDPCVYEIMNNETGEILFSREDATI